MNGTYIFEIVNRTIVPSATEELAVVNDNDSRCITFKIPSVIDGIDITDKILTVRYVNSLNRYDQFFCNTREVVSEGNKQFILFDWVLDSNVTSAKGTVTYDVSIYDTNDINDGAQYILHTKPSTLEVDDGLLDVGAPIEDENTLQEAIDSFNAIASKYYSDTLAAAKSAQAAADAANKSAESLKIDATLTISGQAADAKVVGDKLAGKANSSEVTSIRNDLQNEIDRAVDTDNQLKEDLGNDSSYLFQSIKQQNRAILDIEFESGGIDASNGIIGEAEKSVRTKNFIDLSFYDKFIFNNLRQFAYGGNIIYYNDDKSYNSYVRFENFQRDAIVDKKARYVKIAINEIYADTYPISDWSKYFYFEGIVDKKTEEKLDSFISNAYNSLAIDDRITLSNSIDKVFQITTSILVSSSTEKSYVFDVEPYERYDISLKSYLKEDRALVVLTDDNEKPYKIFTKGEESLKNYEANFEIPPYITRMYVMSTDGNLPVVRKQELKRLTSEGINIWNGKKAVFLGDSITAGSWYNPTLKSWENMTENWTYWVSKLCGMTYKNYGIGGTHVSSAYNSGDGSSAEQAFTNRYSNMDDDADVVFVMGGTNDWLPDHTDTAPFGDISDTTDVSFCGAIRVLCEGLIKKYNGKQIFFFTPICNANQLSANPTTGKTLKEYCDAITEICGMYSIEVINTHVNAPLHFMIAENASKYCSQQDGSTHPNDLGQKLLGEYIARAIS